MGLALQPNFRRRFRVDWRPGSGRRHARLGQRSTGGDSIHSDTAGWTTLPFISKCFNSARIATVWVASSSACSISSAGNSS